MSLAPPLARVETALKLPMAARLLLLALALGSASAGGGGGGGGDASPAARSLSGESDLSDALASLPSGGAVFVRFFMNG